MNQVHIIAHPNNAILRNAALQTIKGFVCPKSNAGNFCLCSTCVAINEKRSSKILWIPPTTSYTRENVEPLHEAALLQRSEREPLFCVLENPEYLSLAAANSLLKTLEEPPAHIMFFLLSQNLKGVLPTIASRSTIRLLESHEGIPHEADHELAVLFLAACSGNPVTGQQIEGMLQKKCPDSSESTQLFEQIITSASGKFPHLLEALYKLRANPPAPGSSKIFWRSAFLSILNLR